MQHTLSLCSLIGKAHMVNVDLAAAVRKLLRVRRVLQRRLHAHQRGKALETGKAARKDLGKIGELAHGADKSGDVERKGDEVNVVDLAAHDEVAAHRDDGGGEQRHEKFHRRVEYAHLMVESTLGDLEFLVRGVEFVDLLVLVGKSTRRANAGERRLDADIDGGSLLLFVARSRAHLAAARHDNGDKHRQNARHHKGKPPLDGEHDNKRADDRQRGDEQVLRPVMGKLRDLEEVARQSAHELTRAVMVKKADVQLLHVNEEVAADIRLYADTERVPPVGDHIVQKRAHDKRRHHHAHDDKKRAVLLLGQQIVHRLARDHREGKVNERDDRRADKV